MIIVKIPLTPKAEGSWNEILQFIMDKQIPLDEVVEDMINIYAGEHLAQWDHDYYTNKENIIDPPGFE